MFVKTVHVHFLLFAQENCVFKNTFYVCIFILYVLRFTITEFDK